MDVENRAPDECPKAQRFLPQQRLAKQRQNLNWERRRNSAGADAGKSNGAAGNHDISSNHDEVVGNSEVDDEHNKIDEDEDDDAATDDDDADNLTCQEATRFSSLSLDTELETSASARSRRRLFDREEWRRWRCVS